MRVCEHGSDITRILIGYVLAGREYERVSRNLFQSRSEKTAFSFICQIIFDKCVIKAIEDFLFRVYIASS